MTTLTHTHTPNIGAISRVITSFEDETQYTFCETCEQNIDRFFFYDDDRGAIWSDWHVTR